MNFLTLFTSSGSMTNRIQPDSRTLSRGAQREVDTGPPDAPPGKPKLSSGGVSRTEPNAQGKRPDPAEKAKQIAAAFAPYVQRVAPELQSIDKAELTRLIEEAFHKAGLSDEALSSLVNSSRSEFFDIAARIANLLVGVTQPHGDGPRYMPGLTLNPQDATGQRPIPTTSSGGNFAFMPGNGVIEIENPTLSNIANLAQANGDRSITTIPGSGAKITIQPTAASALSDEVAKVLTTSSRPPIEAAASLEELLMQKRTAPSAQANLLSEADDVESKGILTSLLGPRPRPSANSAGEQPFGAPGSRSVDAARQFAFFASAEEAGLDWWNGLASDSDKSRTVEFSMPQTDSGVKGAESHSVGLGAASQIASASDAHSKLADEVVERIRLSVQSAVQDLVAAKRGGSVTLRLDPKELGSIVLKVDQSREEVRVRAEASNDAVKALLAENRIELSRALLDKGFNLQQFDVGSDQAQFGRESREAEGERTPATQSTTASHQATDSAPRASAYNIGSGGIDYIA